MIYIARHGESTANRDGVYGGQMLKAPLTKKGLEQAHLLGESVKPLDADVIVSSPIERALDTAKVVKEVANIKAPIVIEDGLAEYDFGGLTGKSTGRPSEEVFNSLGAENPKLFVDRCVASVLKHDRDGKNILFISHGGVMRSIKSVELGMRPEEHRDLRLNANAKIEQVDISAIRRSIG